MKVNQHLFLNEQVRFLPDECSKPQKVVNSLTLLLKSIALLAVVVQEAVADEPNKQVGSLAFSPFINGTS